MDLDFNYLQPVRLFLGKVRLPRKFKKWLKKYDYSIYLHCLHLLNVYNVAPYEDNEIFCYSNFTTVNGGFETVYHKGGIYRLRNKRYYKPLKFSDYGKEKRN